MSGFDHGRTLPLALEAILAASRKSRVNSQGLAETLPQSLIVRLCELLHVIAVKHSETSSLPNLARVGSCE